MKLTALETAVLDALYKGAAKNGHDFGFTDAARSVVPTARALAGVVASLVKKGLIEVHEEHAGFVQFTWTDATESDPGGHVAAELLHQADPEIRRGRKGGKSDPFVFHPMPQAISPARTGRPSLDVC